MQYRMVAQELHVTRLERHVQTDAILRCKFVDEGDGVALPRFQRLHAGDTYDGTGIGLAIVRRIVERHGGRVWAEGTPNEGARLSFTMPRGGKDA